MAVGFGKWTKFLRRSQKTDESQIVLTNLQDAIVNSQPESLQTKAVPKRLFDFSFNSDKNRNNRSLPHLEKLSNFISQINHVDGSKWVEQAHELLKKIEVVAFVGSSGTGKSTRAIEVANQNKIDFFIDDGLLIHGSRILCGTSAKRAATRIQSVRQAIFLDETQADTMRRILLQYSPKTLMILATSDAMIAKICNNLWLELPNRYIRIEEFTTAEERYQAKQTRMRAGQHTIPVPSMEVKHEFNGYFSDSLSKIKKRLDWGRDNIVLADHTAKTVVRPTFSGLGSYSISDEAIKSMALLILQDVTGLAEIANFNTDKEAYGVVISLEISLQYGYNAQKKMREIQKILVENIEKYTSINVMAVNVKAIRVSNVKLSRI